MTLGALMNDDVERAYPDGFSAWPFDERQAWFAEQEAQRKARTQSPQARNVGR